jgi:TolB protein
MLPSARAALTIEIVGSGANQIPIAIAPFRAEDKTAQPLTTVIGADLQRSGLFRLVDPGGIVPVPTEPGEVNFPQWSARGAEALVIKSPMSSMKSSPAHPACSQPASPM